MSETVRKLYLSGQFKEAEALARKQLEQHPKNSELLNLLAFSLQDQERDGEALEVFSRTLAIDPNNFHALYSKGVLLMHGGLLAEAVWYFEKALTRNPNDVQCYNNLGLILQTLGETEKAKAYFKKAQELAPEHPLHKLRYESIGEIFFKDNAAIEQWRAELLPKLKKYKPINLRDYIEEISSSYATPFYYLPYQGRDNLEIYKQYGRIFSGTKETPPESLPNRVGIVVTASTPMVFLTIFGGILNGWDSTKAEAVLFCYAKSYEKIRSFITNPAIKIITIPTHFAGSVEAIKAVRCGLIYYWEIGSDSTNYFLPYFRLAPIQCTSWGTFHTTGIPHMDYFISSVHQEPEGAEKHYTEKLIKLPSLPAYFSRIKSETAQFRRADFGFKEEEHIYLCPQHLCKIHSDFEALMVGLLKADDKAVIMLVESGKFPRWGEKLRARLKENMGVHATRVRFLPSLSRQKYWELLNAADVILDTLHFGGGMTSLEAFSFGLPIVTLPGTFMRGRFTYACYQVMGITECIAKDVKDYIRIATRIASDAAYRASLRQKILEQSGTLYENKNTITEFQDFCLKALGKDI